MHRNGRNFDVGVLRFACAHGTKSSTVQQMRQSYVSQVYSTNATTQNRSRQPTHASQLVQLLPVQLYDVFPFDDMFTSPSGALEDFVLSEVAFRIVSCSR